ncbi:MAG: hypothetical protein KBG10_04545 [Anaerolineaceae bacterium]|nr:hypothetical protein [Anaerolineaceae bacterium]
MLRLERQGVTKVCGAAVIEISARGAIEYARLNLIIILAKRSGETVVAIPPPI